MWRDGRRSEHPLATAARPAVARLGARYAGLVRAHPDAVLEQKGISLSLHTRLLDEKTRLAVEAAALELAAGEPTLAAAGGKRVIEVRPRGAPNKGDAILALLDEAHGPAWSQRCAAVFLGDDLTDEDGFRVLAGRGAGVLVLEGEPRPSAAEWLADGVDDALTLLEAIAGN